MQDIIEPSERDELIYEAWQSSGKSLRVLAREFSTSVTEIDLAIDRCMLPFTTATRMRAYKRENQRLENVCAYYYAKTMEGDIDAGHLFARCDERLAAINGWTSVNIRMDPLAAQAAEQPSQHELIRDRIMTIARGPNWRDLPPDDIDKKFGIDYRVGNGSKDDPPAIDGGSEPQ